MDSSEKISKAKVGILLSHPFFATLMLRRKFMEDANVKSFTINGPEVRYNPEYVDKLTYDETIGTICQSLLHVAMMHQHRRGDRDNSTWQRACDLAINPLIIQAGLKLPKGYLIDDRFTDQAAEQIYTTIYQEPQPSPSGEPGEDMSDVEDNKPDPGQEPAEAEADTKMEVMQAMMVAKQKGNLPGFLERPITEILEPKVPWKEVIARFLCEPARNDYSFSRPNMRYIHTGFVLPSLYNLEVGEIVLIVDTSISMNEELLNKVASEMQDVASTFNTPITVLYVDTKVQGEPQIIEPDEDFVLKPKGGGGTDFRPGFEWLEEQGIVPKSVIYFTDGACHLFPKEPEYPVLWCKYGNYKSKIPFGEVIKVDE